MTGKRDARKNIVARWFCHRGQTGICFGFTSRRPGSAGAMENPWKTTDETMEQVAGVGKPPWSWPPKLAAVDVPHKAVYAFASGAVSGRARHHAAAAGPAQRRTRPRRLLLVGIDPKPAADLALAGAQVATVPEPP